MRARRPAPGAAADRGGGVVGTKGVAARVFDAMTQPDLVITHASLGTVTAAALAGKPQLGSPNHMEQLMTGRRKVEQGLGLIIELDQRSPNGRAGG